MTKNSYKINIDGTWTLEDLYLFPKVYSEVFALLYSVDNSSLQIEEDDRIFFTYTSHPWRGGYSALNFYHYLQRLVPKEDRPTILSIRYSSPGWIELGLAVSIAIGIRKIVKAVAESGKEINTLYNEIYKGLRERKLIDIEVKSKELELKKQELDFIVHSSKCLSKLMGFKNLDALDALTPHPLITLKILLSFYRRVRELVKYEKDKKAKY